MKFLTTTARTRSLAGFDSQSIDPLVGHTQLGWVIATIGLALVVLVATATLYVRRRTPSLDTGYDQLDQTGIDLDPALANEPGRDSADGEAEPSGIDPERIERAIDQADDIIAVISPRWAVQHLNAAYERLTGFTAASRQNWGFGELISRGEAVVCEWAVCYDEICSAVAETGQWSGRMCLDRDQDEALSVEGSVVATHDADGNLDGYVATLRDASQIELLQSELRRAERLSSLGALVAGIAHDFNNLLMPILGSAELAREAETDEERRRFLAMIEHAALQGRDIVDRVRCYGTETSPEAISFDLVELVNQAIRLANDTASTTVRIEASCHDGPAIIHGDVGQTHQMVMKVLTNALQATEVGGGVIRVSLGEVMVEEDEPTGELSPGPHAELIVADTGVGLDEVSLERIFEPFVPSGPGQTAALGLFAVADAVKEMGGSIRVTSRPDVGTSVRLRLPLVTTDRTAGAVGPGDADSLEVLVVDDDPTVLNIVGSLLESLGHRVTRCQTGADAVALVESENRVDMLVTDLSMPEMSGDQLAKRCHEIRANLPILVLTGHLDTDMVPDYCTLVHKPLRRHTLQAAIAKTVGANRAVTL